MAWLFSNWELTLVAVLTIVGLFKGTDWFRYVRLIVALAKAAWSEAEKLGILENLKGADKLAPFMDYFIKLWHERFGETPVPLVQGLAVRIAAKESAMHKVQALASPK